MTNNESGLNPSYEEQKTATLEKEPISKKTNHRIKRVIIVAKGAGKENAPLNNEIDEFTEIWGVNDVVLDRVVSRNFEIHSKVLDDDEPWKKTIEKVIKYSIPCMMCKHYDSIPTSIEYPLQEIIEEFGTDFFTNSIDYMIAYAAYIGVKELDIYGVNMILGGEYMFERPGVNFWCGVAMGRGVKVNVYGKESTIMRIQTGRLYGFDIPQKIDERFLK